MSNWCSIFCATEDRDSVMAAVRAWLAANGCVLYDPFSVIPGASYPVAVKLFVSPTAQGAGSAWVRLILAEPVAGLAEALQGVAPAVLFDLAGGSAAGGATLAGVDLAALSGDAQAMASRVDMKQAGAMANRLIGSLGKRLGASDADAAAARALLAAAQIDWSGAAGSRLIAEAFRLGLPASWQTPDFTTLRDAYAVHKRLERSPNARLYPGDAEARDAVPDALTYTPIFGGKRA
ncbi:MAG: hypothetical protein L6Q98_16445 [Anaerolineae bacterium]|nr:hypothetical protein [Anaerolineae bacterium]NUQ04368.1 hypothetical protein [Anaerolineae bacterium]